MQPVRVVTSTATPASGYSFSSWSGGASGTNASTTVTMNANTSVTANFTTSGGGGTTLRIDDKSGTGTGYCSANGSRQNTYTGADGGYYINLSNSSGQGITWAVSAGAAGTYQYSLAVCQCGLPKCHYRQGACKRGAGECKRSVPQNNYLEHLDNHGSDTGYTGSRGKTRSGSKQRYASDLPISTG